MNQQKAPNPKTHLKGKGIMFTELQGLGSIAAVVFFLLILFQIRTCELGVRKSVEVRKLSRLSRT